MILPELEYTNAETLPLSDITPVLLSLTGKSSLYEAPVNLFRFAPEVDISLLSTSYLAPAL